MKSRRKKRKKHLKIKKKKKVRIYSKPLKKKVKLPIVPYKVSESYPQTLLNILKRNDRLRPKTLLAPEMGDIT